MLTRPSTLRLLRAPLAPMFSLAVPSSRVIKHIPISTMGDEEERGYANGELCELSDNMFTEELQYLSVIENIVSRGDYSTDIAGMGNYSIFGDQLQFSLRDGAMPIITTRPVFWHGVVAELLWFIQGSTNPILLSEQQIDVWNVNSSREYLANIGFPSINEGIPEDLWPVYGFLWRHVGADSVYMSTDYAGESVNKLKEVIHRIKHNPPHRSIMLSYWNPVGIARMTPSPCECWVQFYVENQELSCYLHQKSADMSLSVPFNIASYSLLTHMIAHVTGLRPGEFVHILGDAHVFENHISVSLEQVRRIPKEKPTIQFRREIDEIYYFQYEDIILKNYTPHPQIEEDIDA